MIHVWSAFKNLQSIPSETGFYRHLADDVFDGELKYDRGHVHVPDAHGFGAKLDETKLKKYTV